MQIILIYSNHLSYYYYTWMSIFTYSLSDNG